MNNDHQIAEYEKLRDEILHLSTHVITVVGFTVAALASLAVFIAGISAPSPFLWLAPLGIVLFSFLAVVSRAQAIYKLGAYISVFLEQTDRMQYETRNMRLAPELSRLGKLALLKQIFALYSSFGIFFGVLLSLKSASMFASIGYWVLLLVLVFILLSRYVIVDWRKRFYLAWENLREDEKRSL